MLPAEFDTLIERLKKHLTSVWLRPTGTAPRVPGLDSTEIDEVAERYRRFERPLAALFRDSAWDGRIRSPLELYPRRLAGRTRLWVKCDHKLPMTGTVKARGGVYEMLCSIEEFAIRAGLLRPDDDFLNLLEPDARAALARHRVLVASTGNLGFSVGLVGRAFGVSVEIHMSADAKQWKKDRLRALGALVIEHPTDYEGAVAAARAESARSGAYFIDDERSRRLFAGYSTAARELAAQLNEAGEQISARRPLVVYLPSGVGGAPGGISAGLLQEYGDSLITVFVQPTASACMLVALASGRRQPVYAVGLDNATIADGLAVPTASELTLALIGPRVDAVVAVSDDAMLAWVRQAWSEAGLRLEPSGAAGFAAVAPFLEERASRGDPITDAVHVVWTTGGSLLPDSEFLPLIAS